jgi:uncharacterized protein DUF3618
MTEREPEQLREEIQATREELGETVEAFADKADVKAHAKEKVEEIKSRARSRAPLIAGAGILVALIVLWLIRRD